MNKRLLVIIAAIIVLVAVLAVFLNINRNKISLPAAVSGASSGAGALLNQARRLEGEGDLPGAKAAYEKLVGDFFSSKEVMNWQKKIEELNIRLLFSPAVTPGSTLYEIKQGDTLSGIAREFHTTTDLIKKSNDLSGDRIMPGQKIKVWNAPFSILVDKSQNMLILKCDEEIMKTYVVSTGKDNSTPAGNFKITDRLINPTWFKEGKVVPAGDPENILGTRWLGFNLAGYGIHGTTEPQSLGSQVTQGCVRMSNTDVEELYIIVPSGSEVTIAD